MNIENTKYIEKIVSNVCRRLRICDILTRADGERAESLDVLAIGVPKSVELDENEAAMRIDIGLISLTPVSYTHLDVYKRQQKGRNVETKSYKED